MTQPRGGPDAETPANAEEPHWLNLANGFTMLRVALVPVIAVLVFMGGQHARWWAFGIFVFAAVTDSIDGWVARQLVGVTRWGQLADPLADKALIIGSLAVLAHNEELPWVAVALIILREVWVTAQRTVMLRRAVVMPASPFGKIKTVSQVVAVTLYLLPAGPSAMAPAALWLAVLLTIASGVDYAVRGVRTAHES